MAAGIMLAGELLGLIGQGPSNCQFALGGGPAGTAMQMYSFPTVWPPTTLVAITRLFTA